MRERASASWRTRVSGSSWLRSASRSRNSRQQLERKLALTGLEAQRALFTRLLAETDDPALRQILVERIKRLCRCSARAKRAGGEARSPGIALPPRFTERRT